ncbi:HPP family protein [Paenibacillus radicis (ex Gao et al. 2016)]|uniref:Membrane protein n=1 Tax=Paenibacillus radicis (ex Gao et al. 2016) TaxID=1737354 RepID=A0A917LW49_9BACL|nr:HPP family protein [Paenibacillus radicis (ex Gao et al. 2016)]GGG58961.1 membrane protein [Paenibacillus radicis (ex Gao et al. 2016)]
MSSQTYWSKMKGAGRSPLKVSAKTAIISAAGGFIAIAILAWLTGLTGQPWIMAPFGASCVLAFGVWESPLSQPRNIIGGHFISTMTGLLLFHLFGQGLIVLAVGVALAILFMMLTKTTHPPAGADPIVVILAGSGWSFLFTPVLAGSVVIVLVALLVNNAIRQRSYPTFWL